jgi:hypothetical protein
MHPRTVLAVATALVALAVQPAGAIAQPSQSSQPPAKGCSSSSGTYAPGTIVDSTITTRDASGKLVTKKVRYICGVDGKWHEVKSFRVVRAKLAQTQLVARAVVGVR